MENRCDFDPRRINFWNDTYNLIKHLNYKVYVNFDWSTFKDRKFPFIGAVHIDNLAMLKKSLLDNQIIITNIQTPHYRGIYFEPSPECPGLIIAPMKETDTFKQDLRELRFFGKEHNIVNLNFMDDLSGGLLLKNIEYIVISMAGFYHKDFIELQTANTSFKPFKTAFWCDIYSLMKQKSLAAYIDFDWKTFENRKFIIIGAVKNENFEHVKNSLTDQKFKTERIETFHYIILYFEFTADLFGIFITPKNEMMAMDQSIINSDLEFITLSELKEAGRKNGIENLASVDLLSCTLIKGLYELMMREIHEITANKMRLISYKNSHMEYIKNYLDYKNRNILDHEIQDYHIKKFSGLYYLEIKIISELLEDPDISIHDAGTNVAHFPLLLSALSGEELFGLNISQIIASDNIWTGEMPIYDILKDNPGYKQIHFIKLDLIKEIQNSPGTDVIIANDVLEHLPDDETSFKVLKGLWNKTGKLLIVHVPFENIPNPQWGHCITFNEEKIKNWANRLPGGKSLPQHLYEDEMRYFIGGGFLVVSREDEQTTLE